MFRRRSMKFEAVIMTILVCVSALFAFPSKKTGPCAPLQMENDTCLGALIEVSATRYILVQRVSFAGERYDVTPIEAAQFVKRGYEVVPLTDPRAAALQEKFLQQFNQ